MNTYYQNNYMFSVYSIPLQCFLLIKMIIQLQLGVEKQEL